jgi:hypothetical protein
LPEKDQRSCDGRGGGQRTSYVFHSLCGPLERKKPLGGPSATDLIYFLNKKQRSCDGRGGAQRPVWHVNKPKKTGARSARARTRGQNPLVSLYLSTLSRGGGAHRSNLAGSWSSIFFHNTYTVNTSCFQVCGDGMQLPLYCFSSLWC